MKKYIVIVAVLTLVVYAALADTDWLKYRRRVQEHRSRDHDLKRWLQPCYYDSGCYEWGQAFCPSSAVCDSGDCTCVYI